MLIGDLQSAVFVWKYTEITPCQVSFWRPSFCILEAEIVLGVLYRKGGTPKKGGTLASPQLGQRSGNHPLLQWLPPNSHGHSVDLIRKEPKPKLFCPDIFRWGTGLPHEGLGAKKFGMSLETREIRLFGRDIPGFRRDIQAAPEKFEKIKFVFKFWPL